MTQLIFNMLIYLVSIQLFHKGVNTGPTYGRTHIFRFCLTSISIPRVKSHVDLKTSSLKLDTNCKKMNIFEKISLKNLFQLSTKKIVHHKLKEEIDDDLTREDLPLVSKDQGHELYINQHITDKIGYFGKIIMRK